MTTHTHRTSVVAASAAALLAATLLAGCAGGGSIEDFCADKKAADDIMSSPEAQDPESEEFQDATDRLDDVLQGIDPPSEIEDDWNVLIDATEKYADQRADLDPEDPEDQEEMLRLAEEMMTDEYTEAGERVAAFTEESCEA